MTPSRSARRRATDSVNATLSRAIGLSDSTFSEPTVSPSTRIGTQISDTTPGTDSR